MRARRIVGTASAVVVLVAASIVPAAAFGTGNAIGGACGGGWAWRSYYSNGYSHASTTENGAWCTVSAGLRVYQAEIARQPGSDNYSHVQRYGAATSGGYHHLGWFTRHS